MIEEQREQIIAIIDKYLPFDGIGTERELERMEMYDDMFELVGIKNPKNKEVLESAKMIHFDLATKAFNLAKQHEDMRLGDFIEIPEVKMLLVALNSIQKFYLQNINE